MAMDNPSRSSAGLGGTVRGRGAKASVADAGGSSSTGAAHPASAATATVFGEGQHPTPTPTPSLGSDRGRRSLPVLVRDAILTFGKFVGPGFMIAVAYIDPGNYATGIAAGASYRFRLLFIVLLSNVFAIFLQALCVKLGTVTGLNLAEACRAFLPRWLNYALYAMAEIAIIATDLAEVSLLVRRPVPRAPCPLLTTLFAEAVLGSCRSSARR